MHRNSGQFTTATRCTLIFIGSQGTAAAHERTQPVETGVILIPSTQEGDWFGMTAPFWTPSPEQIAQIEVRIKPYLDALSSRRMDRQAWHVQTAINRLYRMAARNWIFVNSLCESFWKREESWRDRLIIVFDGTLLSPCALRPLEWPVRPAANQRPLAILTGWVRTAAASVRCAFGLLHPTILAACLRTCALWAHGLSGQCGRRG